MLLLVAKLYQYLFLYAYAWYILLIAAIKAANIYRLPHLLLLLQSCIIKVNSVMINQYYVFHEPTSCGDENVTMWWWECHHVVMGMLPCGDGNVTMWWWECCHAVMGMSPCGDGNVTMWWWECHHVVMGMSPCGDGNVTMGWWECHHVVMGMSPCKCIKFEPVQSKMEQAAGGANWKVACWSNCWRIATCVGRN